MIKLNKPLIILTVGKFAAKDLEKWQHTGETQQTK